MIMLGNIQVRAGQEQGITRKKIISLSYKLTTKANEVVNSQNVLRMLKYKLVVGE